MRRGMGPMAGECQGRKGGVLGELAGAGVGGHVCSSESLKTEAVKMPDGFKQKKEESSRKQEFREVKASGLIKFLSQPPPSSALDQKI